MVICLFFKLIGIHRLSLKKKRVLFGEFILLQIFTSIVFTNLFTYFTRMAELYLVVRKIMFHFRITIEIH